MKNQAKPSTNNCHTAGFSITSYQRCRQKGGKHSSDVKSVQINYKVFIKHLSTKQHLLRYVIYVIMISHVDPVSK